MSSVLDALDAATATSKADTTPAPTKPAPAPRKASTDPDKSAELRAMEAEADLLSLIRQDIADGTERASGSCISFTGTCPVCHHRDDFRYYPATNSWACFGGSTPEPNANGRMGGGYLRYVLVTGRARDDADAVRMLREDTGHPYQPAADYSETLELGQVISDGAGKSEGAKSEPEHTTSPKLHLPHPKAVRASDPPKAAPVLVEGLLRRGHVGVLVAKAKSSKSWCAIDLSVSVATGAPWLGYRCDRGAVLYIDPELDPRSLDRRFSKVARARGASMADVDANVARWSLRGAMVSGVRAATVADVVHDLRQLVASGELGPLALVVVDSCSALLSGDENASGDVRAFFNSCLTVAEVTGASVLLVHHEGKARSGDRDAADRGRGSSVWTDAPDLVLSLVETFPPSGEASDYLSGGQRAFELAVAAIREFPPAEHKRLIWSYPTFRLDAEGITDGWRPKSSQQVAGRSSGDARKAKSAERATKCELALLAHMYRADVDPAEGIPASEAADICSGALGATVKAQTLKGYIDASEWLDVWQRSPQRWAIVPHHPKPIQHPRTE